MFPGTGALAGIVVKLLLGAGVFLYIVHTIEAKAVLEREVDLAQNINQKLVQDVKERDARNANHEKRHDQALDRLDTAEQEAEKNKLEIASAKAEAVAARQAALDAAIASGDDDIDTSPQLCPLDCILP